MSNQSNQPKQVFRIDKDTYDEIAKKARPIGLSASTTDLEAGFILGQQSILKILREDILVRVR